MIDKGLVHVSLPAYHQSSDLLDQTVELGLNFSLFVCFCFERSAHDNYYVFLFLDRQLLDFLLGVDLEIAELVDGADLYTPKEELKDVVLPGSYVVLSSFINLVHFALYYR
jgi:hypothetical protein